MLPTFTCLLILLSALNFKPYLLKSTDKGKNWSRKMLLTKNSKLNHGYVRRPLDYEAPFCFFWADGNPHQFSRSELYFGNFDGDIWKLPYTMKNDFEEPQKIAGTKN